MKIIYIFLLFISLFTTSCASKKKEVKNAATEYKKAMEILKNKSYNEAATKFEELSDEYPLSEWSIKGQAIAAYSYFAEENYEEVIRVATEFKSLYPASNYVSYLQYMKALSHFKLMPDIRRGQDDTRLASYDLRELIARFPRSKYIKDAKEKLIIINENLAASMMSTGRYQIKTENYVGAIMKFSKVTYQYPKTKQAAEAYARLYEIYYKLGMIDLANKTKKEMLIYHKNGQWPDYIKKISSKKI